MAWRAAALTSSTSCGISRSTVRTARCLWYKLGVGLTMVLTSVAFKFAMAADLPRLPYATHMDNYIMANMLMQLIVCFHVGVAGRRCPATPTMCLH